MFLRTPTFWEQRFVVSIVEFALISGSAPMSIVTRIIQVSLSECVSSRNCGYSSPCMPVSELCLENIVNEDSLKTFTSFFWIWHETNGVWTFLKCLSTNHEIFSKFESQCFSIKWIISIIMGLKARNDHLTHDYNEVRQTEFVAIFLEDVVDFESDETLGKAFVVWIVEIHASISASSWWFATLG